MAARQGREHLRQLHPRQPRGHAGRLRRGAAARHRRLRRRGLRREHLHREGRPALHAAAHLGARRHHLAQRAADLRRPRHPGREDAPHPRRHLHRRRGLLHRHRGRGHADPRARPAHDRQRLARPRHGEDPDGVLRHRERPQPEVPPLAHQGRPDEPRAAASLQPGPDGSRSTAADLPLHCPLPSQKLWNTHPRVFLPSRRPARRAAPTAARSTARRRRRRPATTDGLRWTPSSSRPSWIGDAVLSHPLLVRLKARDPRAPSTSSPPPGRRPSTAACRRCAARSPSRSATGN